MGSICSAGRVCICRRSWGVILAYIKRDDARGTIWESHFANQIETFWVSLVIGIVAIPLCFVFIGIPAVILAGVFIWFPVSHD